MKNFYRRVRDSRKTKDFLVSLIFIGIAAVFWLILALNDDMQNTYDVNLTFEDVPDSVTFINLPPEKLHVTVRDRGLNMLRHKITGAPSLSLHFNEYSEDGKLRVSHNSMQAALRRIFGSSASVSAVTPDSLLLSYTTFPGHRLPVELQYDVTVAPGMVLGTPVVSSPTAELFSQSNIDTLRRLLTEKVVLRNIDKTTSVDVPMAKLPGNRVEPATVKVTFVVEPLVKKESEVSVEADNIPLGHDILFFPSRVRIAYYVPMSRYAETNVPIKVEASFNEAFNTSSDKVGIRIVSTPSYVSNVELLQDSVEYTVVKSN